MKEKTPSILEERIRARLAERKLSVSQFARELGVSRVTIYHLFRGIYSRKLMKRVAQALDVSFHYFLEGVGISPSEDVALAFSFAPPTTQQAVRRMLGMENRPRVMEKPLVIVVDDVQDNAEFLERILRKEYDVLIFTDPTEALEAIRKRDVRVVISDQRMPRMSGTRLLAEVETLRRGIAKVIVSAYSDNGAFLDAINESNVDAFLVKPVVAQELRNRVARLASRPTDSLPVH